MPTAREIAIAAEVAALERRAAAIGLKPSVLARNLIREGLAERYNWDGSDGP